MPYGKTDCAIARTSGITFETSRPLFCRLSHQLRCTRCCLISQILASFFHQGSYFLGVLQSTAKVVVTGAAIKGQQLKAMRTLQLNALANAMSPLPEHHRTL